MKVAYSSHSDALNATHCLIGDAARTPDGRLFLVHQKSTSTADGTFLDEAKLEINSPAHPEADAWYSEPIPMEKFAVTYPRSITGPLDGCDDAKQNHAEYQRQTLSAVTRKTPK